MSPQEAAREFLPSGRAFDVRVYGNGHINDTYLVTHLEEKEPSNGQFILQRVNRRVFKDPVALMENFIAVTEFLRASIIEAGGDPERETLNLIPDRQGKKYFTDPDGEIWRATKFIFGATSYEQVAGREDFYESGYSFGHFQHLLADFPADKLSETIPDFHNTVKRLEHLRATVENDAFGRKAAAEAEIAKAEEYAYLAPIFTEAVAKGEIPLRVTHNDTKFNNIMIDDASRKGICVLDLDTVMPGVSMNDFGDSIRFGANTAVEDEKDLSKVSLDLDLYETYTEGFLKGLEGSLTEREVSWLPLGAMMMTYENGIRFLADFLEGDIYFKTAYPEHNLVRARVQFRLLDDMKRKEKEMDEIIDRLR